jgi:hypothetical protein
MSFMPSVTIRSILLRVKALPQSVTRLIATIVTNLVTLKAIDKNELLFDSRNLV